MRLMTKVFFTLILAKIARETVHVRMGDRLCGTVKANWCMDFRTILEIIPWDQLCEAPLRQSESLQRKCSFRRCGSSALCFIRAERKVWAQQFSQQYPAAERAIGETAGYFIA